MGQPTAGPAVAIPVGGTPDLLVRYRSPEPESDRKASRSASSSAARGSGIAGAADLGEGGEVPELLFAARVEPLEGRRPVGAQIRDEIAQVLAFVAGGHEAARRRGGAELVQVALLALAPRALGLGRLLRRRVRAIEHDREDRRAEALGDLGLAVAPRGRLRGVFEGVVEERRDHGIRVAARPDHEALHLEQMAHVGRRPALAGLRAVPGPGDPGGLQDPL